MNEQGDQSITDDIPGWVRKLRIILGLLGFLGGTVSLLGWILDIPRLTDWGNSGVSIQPTSAVGPSPADPQSYYSLSVGDGRAALSGFLLHSWVSHRLSN